MINLKFLVLFVGLACTTARAQQSSNESNFLDYSILSVFTKYETFDWDLFMRLNNPQNENVLVSPISLKIAMALLYEAADGLTKSQIGSVMDFLPNEADVRFKFKTITDSLKTPENGEYILDLGSRMYLDKGINIQQKYGSLLEQVYATEVKHISDDTSKTVKDANDWVKEVTHGNIDKLLSDDDLENAVVLLLNTVYFKGSWVKQFLQNETRPGSFHLNSSRAISTLLMSQTNKFDFYNSEELKAKILRMPYKGDKLSMTLILPNAIHGLSDVINMLRPSRLNKELPKLEPTNVKVVVPKFHYDFEARLIPLFKEMGIHDLFENTASLPKLARGNALAKKLSVSNILQKSGIDFNELGSTAFSATEVTLVNKFGEDDDVEEFIATHPFIFFIEDLHTKQILFIGKMDDPTKADGAAGVPVTQAPTPQPAGMVSSQGAPNRINLSPQAPSARPVFNSRFNYFDTELMRATAAATQGNFMVSPASIKATLVTLMEGARGACREELKTSLRLPEDQQATREQLNAFITSLTVNTPGITLESANTIFLSNRLSPKPDYQQLLTDVYQSQVQLLNFTDAQGSANAVNDWVKHHTKGLIDSLVEPQNFQPDHVLLLANALYFKGIWDRSFDPKLTTEKCFQLPTGCQPTPMMEIQDTFNYGLIEGTGLQAIELPYQGGKYTMLLLLPSESQPVDSVIRDLPFMSLPSILSQMEETDVQLTLPRFKIEFSTEMVPVLRNVGIHQIFSSAANLSGIVGLSGNPQVNSVLHKTYIEVNEKGSEAAAVTGAMVIPLMGVTTARMTFNHPFLFFIRDTTTGTVLFEGRVNQPEESRPAYRPKQDARPQFSGSFNNREDRTTGSANRFQPQSQYDAGQVNSNQYLKTPQSSVESTNGKKYKVHDQSLHAFTQQEPAIMHAPRTYNPQPSFTPQNPSYSISGQAQSSGPYPPPSYVNGLSFSDDSVAYTSQDSRRLVGEEASRGTQGAWRRIRAQSSPVEPRYQNPPPQDIDGILFTL